MEHLAARLERLEGKLGDLEVLKDEFGEQLKARLATMEAESQGALISVVEHARDEFENLKNNLQTLYGDAAAKYIVRQPGQARGHG